MTKTLKRAMLIGLTIAGVAGFSGAASARIVCNDDGDCWHTDNDYHYHSGWHVRDRHPDSWYFHNDWDHDHDHHWRGHHDGRGYWRNGVWITF